jgi:hypothetical protein
MTSPAPVTEPPRASRREAVQALVEKSYAEPDAPRPVARPHVILTVAVLAAAGALAAGVVLQLVSPVALPTPVRTAPPAPLTAAPFTAVSGWDCGISDDRGFDVQGRTSKWYTVPTGAWGRDGCHGTYETIPVSGDPAKDTPGLVLEWWFQPGPAMTRCDVSVYQPAPGRARDAGATAARYLVLAGHGGSVVAAVVGNQTTNPGTWQRLGTFPVSERGIAVRLVDRGGAATSGGRLAVTQMRVECSA